MELERIGIKGVQRQNRNQPQAVAARQWNGRQVRQCQLGNFWNSLLINLCQRAREVWNTLQRELLHRVTTPAIAQARARVTSKHLLIGVVVIALLGAIAIVSMNAYTRHKNSKIKEVDCHLFEVFNGVTRDFNFYKNAAENSGQATDQYCLAKMLATGNGISQSLEHARNWYKKAADQGLSFAQKDLCQPAMFEIKFALGNVYSKFWHLCCPDASFHFNANCPWYDVEL